MRGHRGLFQAALAVLACAAAHAWADPSWPDMPYTSHAAYQAVDGSGAGTFPTIAPVKMRGVILNAPCDMLDASPGADPFMGGQWQVALQAVDTDDYGGTTLWMGQNVGKIMGNHPAGSYTDAAWLQELDRLNHDPATGRLFRPGDLVEVRARAPGLFHNGKANINEQHSNDPAANFDVILLQPNAGLPEPQVLTLADLKDSSDRFIFDPARAFGDEHYQGAAIRINDVSFVDPSDWRPSGQLLIQDATGRTFPVLLGLGEGFTRYPPPAAPFDIVGILDQEDAVEADGFKDGYRLWAMNYDGDRFVLFLPVKPDFDGDGDVDAHDLSHLQDCVTAPAIRQTSPECTTADFDGDGDVDQDDFGILQRCFTGTDGLANPMCDE
jgi:hypothetical protein